MPDVPLSPQRDDADLDPQLISALQRYDERLLEGTTPDASAVETVEDFPAAAEAFVNCLQLLQRVWPRIPQIENDTTARPVQLGRFQLQKVLGQGGFGTVYLAHDPQLGRAVAVKLPRLHALAHPGLRERFHREARAAAGLDHPHIVPVYEAGEADGVCFIVSAYCPGPSLANWLKERGKRGVPLRQAAQLVVDLADAVAYSHSKGVLHRDIKPGNVLLAPTGSEAAPTAARTSSMPATSAGSSFVPRLSDFGLAKLMDEAGGAIGPEETSASVTLGTPAYMAPEQVKGDEQRNAPTVDVYALGAVLYELLVGHPPFQGAKVADVLEQVRSVEPRPLRQLRRDVPRDLETICLKCLEKSPDQRYRSAAELRDDLQSFLNGEPIVARPPGPLEISLKWIHRRPAVAALCGTVAVALAALVGLQTWHTGDLAATNRKLERSLADARRLQGEAVARASKLRHNTYSSSLPEAQSDLFKFRGASARAILEESIPIVPSDPDVRGIEWDYLYFQARGPEPLRVLPHGERHLESVAISADGNIGVTGDDMGRIRVWNLETGSELASLAAHDARVATIQFSDDGRYLASGGSFQNVCIWSAENWMLVKTLKAHANTSTVESVDFSDDGRWIVTGARDGRIRIWDWQTETLVHEHEVTGDVIYRARLTPDNHRVYCSLQQGRVICWDVGSASVAEVVVHPTHPNMLGCDVSRDGDLLVASGYSTGEITFTRLSEQRTISVPKERGTVYAAALSDNGSRGVLGWSDGQITVVDCDANLTRLHQRRWFGHSNLVKGVALASNRSLALTASHDGTAKLWNLSHLPDIGETLGFAPEPEAAGQHQISATADGTRLAAVEKGISGDALVIYELPALVRHRVFRLPERRFDCPEFSHDGQRIFVRCLSDDAPAILAHWDLESDGGVRFEPLPDVDAYALLPGDERVVVNQRQSLDHSLIVWNRRLQSIERNLLSGLPPVHRISVSRNGTQALLSRRGAPVMVVDLVDGRRREYGPQMDELSLGLWNRSETHLIVAAADSPFELFDVGTAETNDLLPWVPAHPLKSVAVSPSGRRLAFNCRLQDDVSPWFRINITNAESNRRLLSLFSFGLDPTGVVWLRDENTLAASVIPNSSREPCIILWHLSDPDHDLRSTSIGSSVSDATRHGDMH